MSKMPPPSLHERKVLVEGRKRDLPRPEPAPAPKGMGASRDATHNRQQEQARSRESRIQHIDQALTKAKDKSRQAFTRERGR